MSFKDLLFATFTYPDPTPDKALRSGAALAARLGGSLTLMAARVQFPRLHNPIANALIDLDNLATEDEERSAAVAAATSRRLAIAAEEAGVPFMAMTKVSRLYEEEPKAVGEARTHDLCLVAIGNSVANDRAVAEAVLFGSGRPVVIFPDDVEVSAAPRFSRAAIAWDGGSRSARAVADALPVLTTATEVRILVIVGEKVGITDRSADDLVRHLRAHGISASVDMRPAEGAAIGQVLRTYVAEAAIDLLVMGGFGHSRSREFILGGATAAVLDAPPCPVLLSH